MSLFKIFIGFFSCLTQMYYPNEKMNKAHFHGDLVEITVEKNVTAWSSRTFPAVINRIATSFPQ